MEKAVQKETIVSFRCCNKLKHLSIYCYRTLTFHHRTPEAKSLLRDMMSAVKRRHSLWQCQDHHRRVCLVEVYLGSEAGVTCFGVCVFAESGTPWISHWDDADGRQAMTSQQSLRFQRSLPKWGGGASNSGQILNGTRSYMNYEWECRSDISNSCGGISFL